MSTTGNPINSREYKSEFMRCGGMFYGEEGQLALDSKGRLCVNRNTEQAKVKETSTQSIPEGKNLEARQIETSSTNLITKWWHQLTKSKQREPAKVEQKVEDPLKQRVSLIFEQVLANRNEHIQKIGARVVDSCFKAESIKAKQYKILNESLQLLDSNTPIGFLNPYICGFAQFNSIIVQNNSEYKNELKALSNKALDKAVTAHGSVAAMDFARHLIALYMSQKETELLSRFTPEEKSSPENLTAALATKKTDDFHPYLVECVNAKATAWKTMTSLPNSGHLKYEDMHRFIIDGKLEEYGTFIFENELYYTADTFKALNYALTLKADTIDSGQYLELLETAMARNKLSLIGMAVDIKTNTYRTNSTGFAISTEHSQMDQDEIGIEDLRDRSGNSDVLFQFSQSGNRKILQHRHLKQGEAQNKAKAIFNHMQTLLSNAQNKGQRLMAYIWAARELEINHVFPDGNGRCSNMLLTGLITNDKDLPMMMLYDPNVLDANGPNKLVDRVLEGMARYAQFANIPKDTLKLDEIRQEANTSDKKWSYYHELGISSKDEI